MPGCENLDEYLKNNGKIPFIVSKPVLFRPAEQ
jgi:hypothetical protein